MQEKFGKIEIPQPPKPVDRKALTEEVSNTPFSLVKTEYVAAPESITDPVQERIAAINAEEKRLYTAIREGGMSAPKKKYFDQINAISKERLNLRRQLQKESTPTQPTEIEKVVTPSNQLSDLPRMGENPMTEEAYESFTQEGGYFGIPVPDTEETTPVVSKTIETTTPTPTQEKPSDLRSKINELKLAYDATFVNWEDLTSEERLEQSGRQVELAEQMKNLDRIDRSTEVLAELKERYDATWENWDELSSAERLVRSEEQIRLTNEMKNVHEAHGAFRSLPELKQQYDATWENWENLSSTERHERSEEQVRLTDEMKRLDQIIKGNHSTEVTPQNPEVTTTESNPDRSVISFDRVKDLQKQIANLEQQKLEGGTWKNKMKAWFGMRTPNDTLGRELDTARIELQQAQREAGASNKDLNDMEWDMLMDNVYTDLESRSEQDRKIVAPITKAPARGFMGRKRWLGVLGGLSIIGAVMLASRDDAPNQSTDKQLVNNPDYTNINAPKFSDQTISYTDALNYKTVAATPTPERVIDKAAIEAAGHNMNWENAFQTLLESTPDKPTWMINPGTGSAYTDAELVRKLKMLQPELKNPNAIMSPNDFMTLDEDHGLQAHIMQADGTAKSIQLINPNTGELTAPVDTAYLGRTTNPNNQANV